MTLLALALWLQPLEVRAYQLAYPSDLDAMILIASQDHDLDPFLFRALLWVESRLEPAAQHRHSGAVGIAQLSPGGRRAIRRLRGGRFTRADALRPERAIPASAMLLAHLVARCGSVVRGLGAYGSGRCGGAGRFARYVVRVARRLRTEAGLPPGVILPLQQCACYSRLRK